MRKLFLIITQNRRFIGTILGVLVPFFWFLNFSTKQSLSVNIAMFILYFALNSLYLSLFLRKYLEIKFSIIIGIFCLFYLLSFGISIPIVFYKIYPSYLFIILAVISIALSLFSRFQSHLINQGFPPHSSQQPDSLSSGKNKNIPLWWKISFSLLFLGSIFVLSYSRISSVIRSPWQEIHPIYIYFYMGLIFLALYLIKIKPNFKIFIFVVVLISLLLHSYLIFPYEAGFGGDKWRHLGAEKWLMDGKAYLPVLFGKNVSFKKFGPFKIPEVLLVGNKTSYANLWGGAIALSWLVGLPLFWIDIFLGFLLGSIFLPFLLYELGRKFFKKRETIYFFLLAPLFFFPFQLYGSLTVPLFFGFLPFCFLLLIVLRYLEGKLSLKAFLLALILSCIFLYFNYIIYLVLYLMIVCLAVFLRGFSKSLKPVFLILSASVFLFVFGLVFPGLDIISGYSWLKPNISLANGVQNFSQSILFSREIFPRPQGLEQDSWLYSGVEGNLTNSIFGEIFDWPKIFTPLFLLIVICGFLAFFLWSSKKNIFLVLSLLVIILISEFISSSFMEGNCIFSKRLVLAHSFLLFFPFAAGLTAITDAKKNLFLILIIFLSLFAVTIYISGPKFDAVTGDEFRAAKYIWQDLSSKKGPYCVLSNTWPLLSLEGISGRQIVAGGFPVYREYAQPERVQLFENLNRYPHINDFKRALQITKASSCYFMTEERWIAPGRKEEVLDSLSKIVGQPVVIGDVYIWHFQPDIL